MKVYVVLCQYDGCEDCSPGAHIVSVRLTKEDAQKDANEHEAMKHEEYGKRPHFHYYNTDVIEADLH